MTGNYKTKICGFIFKNFYKRKVFTLSHLYSYGINFTWRLCESVFPILIG